MTSSRAILVDTSTLFSGLGWSGPPSQVLITIADGDFELVLTDYILGELFKHLRDFPTDRREPALRSFEYLKQATVIDEERWMAHFDRAKQEVGENKDASIRICSSSCATDPSEPMNSINVALDSSVERSSIVPVVSSSTVIRNRSASVVSWPGYVVTQLRTPMYSKPFVISHECAPAGSAFICRLSVDRNNHSTARIN